MTLLLLFASVSAQELKYRVVDKDNGSPVALAYVNLYSNQMLRKTAQTDDSGFASLTLSSYPCTVKISLAGYETYALQYDSTAAADTYKIFLQKKYSTLNEVVVTGVVQPVRLKDALSNYQVIPRSVIQAQGSVTLNEVLSKQLNMSVSGNDDILGPNLRMQGLDGSKVKILMDGLPVNGREGGNINLTQISMNNVERIELIQGPMSVIYGTDAIGGIINIITKREHKPFGFHAGVYLTTVNKYNVDGSITFSVKKKSQFTVGVARNFFEGWKNIDVPIGYHGDTMRTNRCFLFKPNEQYFANLGYSYKATSGFKLNFFSDLLNDKVTNKGSLHTWDPFTGARAKDEYYYTDRINNRIALQGNIGKSGHWISQNNFVNYHRVRKTVDKDLVTMQETLSQGQGEQDTTNSNDYSFRGGYSNKLTKLNYTVGYDVNLQFFNSLKILNRKANIQDYALYADLSYPLIAKTLTVNGGLRGIYNTRFQPPLIPAVNLLYTPLDNVQVRASYTQGYRAPTLKEMYLDFVDINHDIRGNDSLKAERSKQAQLSVSWQAIEANNNYLQFIVSGYYNDVYDQITLVKVHPSPLDNRYRYQNYAHLQNAIANLQADGQWKDLHAVLGYSYIHTFSSGNSFTSFGVNELTATLQYLWHKPGINFNAFFKYTGAQPFLYIDDKGEAHNNGWQYGYGILDASVEKKLYKGKLIFIAGVKNLLNIQTVNTAGVTMTGAHSGGTGATGAMLPRSLFTSISINLD